MKIKAWMVLAVIVIIAYVLQLAGQDYDHHESMVAAGQTGTTLAALEAAQ